MKKIQQIYHHLQRHVYLAMALQLFGAILLVPLFTSHVAAAQLTSRTIQMSDSSPSGAGITTGIGSGTNVAYKVSFLPSSNAAIGGIVVEFCASTPLIGDTCSAPTANFTTNRSTVTIAAQNNLGAGSFTVYTSDTVANRIIVTKATAGTPSVDVNNLPTIEFGNGTSTGFTNPSSTGTFYARIYTYPTAATAQAHSTTNPTGNLDFGGIALSTVTVITITARVQETLIFCVFGGSAPSANCASNGTTLPPALEIGHVTTGSKKYIDSSVVDTTPAYMQLSTNAGSGAIVRMRNSSSIGGLNSGTNSIPPVNGGAGTSGAMTSGTAAFGLFVAAGTGGIGTVNPDANYSTNYGMDTTTAGNSAITGYGDPIASSTAPVSNVNNTLTFAATASNVTPAGLYSANISLIASGTF